MNQTNQPDRLAPIDLVYRQVERVLYERAMGQGATEAIAGLMDMIDPLKDDLYYSDVRNTPKDYNADEVVHYTLQVVIRLLERKKLWSMKMVVRYGEEFIQGT
jgi:hypothetical protein